MRSEEILYQCDGKIDMVVIGAGTGGTISGVAKKLQERLPNVKVGIGPHAPAPHERLHAACARGMLPRHHDRLA